MTTRILHLVDAPHAGWPALEAIGTLLASEHSGQEHTVVLLGGAPADQLARDWHLGTVFRIAPPLSLPQLAVPALRALVQRIGQPDLVHAWSPATLSLAHLARLGVPYSATLSQPPSHLQWSPARLLALRAAASSSRLIFASRLVMERWTEELGFRRSGIEPFCLPFAVEPPVADVKIRAELRAEWGLSHETVAILATGEPESRIDARWFTFRAGVLAVTGVPSAIVLSAQSDALERALRYTERHRHAWRVIIEDRPVLSLIPACDVALWRCAAARSGMEICGAHALALCAAAGLPCIGEDHPLTRELLGSSESVRLIPPADSVAMTRALFDVVERMHTDRPERGVAPSAPRREQWRARMREHLFRAAGADAPLPRTSALPA